jgi:hypothetical protein
MPKKRRALRGLNNKPMAHGALIALDIPAPERPESSIDESCSRAHLNERINAAPQSQVRPSALPCKAC